MRIKLDSIDGSHMAFYYCSPEHLAINALEYLKEGEERKQKLYIYMDPLLFGKLNQLFEKLGDGCNIEHLYLEQLIQGYKADGIQKLRGHINELVWECRRDRYEGIRAIVQVAFAIKQTSKEDFLNFEEVITGIIENTAFSLMCTYDFYDFITKKQIIDKEVIKKSLKTHPYILNQFSIKVNTI